LAGTDLSRTHAMHSVSVVEVATVRRRLHQRRSASEGVKTKPVDLRLSRSELQSARSDPDEAAGSSALVQASNDRVPSRSGGRAGQRQVDAAGPGLRGAATTAWEMLASAGAEANQAASDGAPWRSAGVSVSRCSTASGENGGGDVWRRRGRSGCPEATDCTAAGRVRVALAARA
jgi:hypothetical protein